MSAWWWACQDEGILIRENADDDARPPEHDHRLQLVSPAIAAALRERDAWREDYREAIRHIPFAPAAPKAEVRCEGCEKQQEAYNYTDDVRLCDECWNALPTMRKPAAPKADKCACGKKP